MELYGLILLVEIIDAGNLSEAARRLKITRANVSYHLKQLEQAAGIQLVRRTTRRIEPTEIGLRLYRHGCGIRNELLAAKETVSKLGQGLQGRVRLSVPSGYGQMVMAPWLIEFKRLYPNIVLEVLFENRVDNLMREEVDIAIRVMAAPPENLVARELGTMTYLACASREYAAEHGLPTQLDQLRTTPLITSAVIGRQLRISAYLGNQRSEVTLEPTMISEHFPFLRQAILAGLGVGLVPDYVVKDELESGEVVTTLNQFRLSIYGNQMFLMYMPDRHQTRATQTLIKFILERARPDRSDADSEQARVA